MNKFIEKYNSFEEKLLVGSLVLNVIIVFIQIIMRSFFNTSLTWSEELSRYIFIWQIWLGTSIAYSKDEHIKVDLIFAIFKGETAKKIIDTLVDIIWLIFSLFMVYQGFKLLGSMNARNALSSGMRIPLIYVYASVPISFLIVSIRIVFDIFNGFKNTEVVEDNELEEGKEV
ncbi:TRAP transporter small permease [Anaerosphaera multitolerans]|uniref:TRAP transporter small permease n=1 Tax=Anaerosphaera multitolerans TaxID=2487351 RepID=A0A437S6Z3_9FIRM|nr:TRAP transporter small permease [Anaerosphaera multitolerans]RVU54718.1 TRAP transporter small permease [Anaerosphaera multitolerans]